MTTPEPPAEPDASEPKVVRSGGFIIDRRTERHEFTAAEWRQRQRDDERREARWKREKAAWDRSRAEHRAWLTETLGLTEAEVKRLEPTPADEKVYAWLAEWPAGDPMQRRVCRLLVERWRANLELNLAYYGYPATLKRRLAVALATPEEAPKKATR
jgi:hypothetical protein